jgi:hypothetical protein
MGNKEKVQKSFHETMKQNQEAIDGLLSTATTATMHKIERVLEEEVREQQEKEAIMTFANKLLSTLTESLGDGTITSEAILKTALTTFVDQFNDGSNEYGIGLIARKAGPNEVGHKTSDALENRFVELANRKRWEIWITAVQILDELTREYRNDYYIFYYIFYNEIPHQSAVPERE